MLLELITALNIQFTFIDKKDIVTYCANPNYVACIWMSSTGHKIYLTYEDKYLDVSLHHEIGHALFFNDEEALRVIKDYPATRDYEEKLMERLAGYYSRYKTDKDFGTTYPCLYIYFRDKELLMLANKKKP